MSPEKSLIQAQSYSSLSDVPRNSHLWVWRSVLIRIVINLATLNKSQGDKINEVYAMNCNVRPRGQLFFCTFF